MAEVKYIEGYPEDIFQLIPKVHETRAWRAENIPAAMTKEERQEVLKIQT